MTNRERIFTDITAEREAQDAKWGKQTHSMPIWSAILGEECGEVAEACLQVHWSASSTPEGDEYPVAHLREELVQVAAVAVHVIEKIDSGDWVRGE